MTRFLQERESESSESTNLLKIMERSVFSDRNVFVSSVQEQGWFSELELDLYHAWSCPMIRVRVEWFLILSRNLRNILQALPCLVPDGFIYLQVAPSVCMKRLRQRARGEEIDVTLEYLESLHAKHEGWLSKVIWKHRGVDMFNCSFNRTCVKLLRATAAKCYALDPWQMKYVEFSRRCVHLH